MSFLHAARAIWRGRIRIERQATGASASSLNRVILLEDGARCVAVPTLEIIPEDIKKVRELRVQRYGLTTKEILRERMQTNCNTLDSAFIVFVFCCRQATHGAAIRDFDTEPLFYMMSRGLPVLEAKRLLMLVRAENTSSSFKKVSYKTFCIC